MRIRTELPQDAEAISAVIERSFARAAHRSGTEQSIVAVLRNAGALSVSLVAEEGGTILGHVAISPVEISDGSCGWYGLGPLAVEPPQQSKGVGASLVVEALARLRTEGAAGCVVLGDPAYYRRFGFEADAALVYAGAPPGYLLAIRFGSSAPRGAVTYHSAFAAEASP
jgi:putative acetyltransferase